MRGVPEATPIIPIILTEVERTELEALPCSTKTEYRLRQRARIVLSAADGALAIKNRRYCEWSPILRSCSAHE